MMHFWTTSGLLVIWSVILFRPTHGNKGPPSATVELTHVKTQLGQNVKLNCEIAGFPTPMYEWFKDGEKIDHTWMDYVMRSNNKVLKIKSASAHDTGEFLCKGVNGFGSATARMQLIVVDPQDSNVGDFREPEFTSETKVAPLHYFRKVGETFSITCEALGNPNPEIIWLKNGKKLGSGVKYIHAGKSSVDLVILDTSDGGLYSCMARNALGIATQNYSLEVNSNSHSSLNSNPLVVVTAITPANSTIIKGRSGKLTCTVRSPETPHIKWLKQLVGLEKTASEAANILNVRDNRYQILPAAEDIKLSSEEFINVLKLEAVTEADNGTYFCFVAKNGLNSLTFKSATVHVVPEPSTSSSEIQLEKATSEGHISLAMMLAIIGLSVASIAMLIILAVCYLRHMRQSPKQCTGSNTGTSESSLPESPDDRQHFLKANTYEPDGLLQRPNFVYAGQFWGQNHHIYPASQQFPLLQNHWPHHQYQQQQQQQQKVTFRSASHHEIVDDNQYEVPFGHLMRPSNLQLPYVGSLSSIEHFNANSNSFMHHGYVQPQIQRSKSSSMRPNQFYLHHGDT